MKSIRDTPDDKFTAALEAVSNLLEQELSQTFNSGQIVAMTAHHEIELRPPAQKGAPFYQHYLPFRQVLVSVLAESYRRLFKLALAHPRQAGRDPHQWVWFQLRPAIGSTLEQIHDWYVLACDGENRYVQRIASTNFVPGQTVSVSVPLNITVPPTPKSWRAPSWLFAVGLAVTGIGSLKTKNVPAMNSEEKLGIAHTRLLLIGARRLFLWALGAATERIRNEETAAAGAIPDVALNRRAPGPIKRQGWEQKIKLHSAIRNILTKNSRLQGMEFCAELDKHHAPPLYDWTKRGEWQSGLTWKEAWSDSGLRSKIRRVRQEAMKQR